ncbi:hypothetical protein WAK64_18930 [Bacillus spongiae]|uniref:YknX-like barrel-sandwich hybrid domain-containing protein n=1 Tax=Bacillus spongiae TaxID=2683610 RepID=A0ABU8HI97_9BACI
MKKKQTMVALIGLLITLNFYLLFHKNNDIPRLTLLSEWEKVAVGSIEKTLQKDGVVVPTSEQHVIFQQEYGTPSTFLVTEGDQVEIGTPLFEYNANNIEARLKELDRLKSIVEKEVATVKSHIAELESLQRTLPSFGSAEPDENQEEKASTLEIDYNLKAEIAANEHLLEQLEAKKDAYNDEKSDLSRNQSNLTVKSDVSGVIKEISYSLENPIMTIVSKEIMVTGTLTEEQTLEVRSPMKATITSLPLNHSFKGVVDKVASLPKDDPLLEQDSLYQFNVEIKEEEPFDADEDDEAFDTDEEEEPFDNTDEENETSNADEEEEPFDTDEEGESSNADEEDEPFDTDEEDESSNADEEDESFDDAAEADEAENRENSNDNKAEEKKVLLPGYHVKVDITTDEAIDVNVLPTQSIGRAKLQHFVWSISPNGEAIKLPIKKGLEVDGKVEIMEGVTKGDIYIANKTIVREEGSTIIKPIYLDHLRKKELKDLSTYNIFKAIVYGLVER